MFPLLPACRRITQAPKIRGYNTRRTYTKDVDQAHGFSNVLAEWRLMRLFMGGLGALILGQTVFEFTLVRKLAVFEAYLAVFEANLNEMRCDMAIIKGKMLGIPVSREVFGVPPPAEALVSKGKETKK
ncbi:hypothetical protein TWF718_002540 [Orbilia javanica]|uniref:Uncharacterized protein n=1 Tax=Orbilia javanica TaxID=47235 RepID=A0AAN8MUC7_9PEZI